MIQSSSALQPYFRAMVWSRSAAMAVLAAMRTVATQGGDSAGSAIATDLILAARDHIFGLDVPLSEIPAVIEPAVFARQVTDVRQRQLAIQLLVLVPYLPIDIDPAMVAQVDAFAAAVDVAPATLQDLHRVRDRRFGQLVWGYSRRALRYLAPKANVWQQLQLLYKFVRQYMGDVRVARRYQALATYPVGSLGRAFYGFYRDRNFPLPGEKGSFSEALVTHDLLHLLSGIGTDAAGEIEAAGFEAGLCSSEVGFEFLMEVILDFHLGEEFTTFNLLEPSRGQFRPQAVLKAFVRGTQVSRDLLHLSWDFWAVMAQPIDIVRQRYGIEPPVAVPSGLPGLAAV